MIKSSRILIIEDEHITAQLIRKMLENQGYSIAGIITSGEEALESVGIINPDLIIMDITLSGNIDGIETASKINQQFGIPIVYLTANTNFEIIQRAKEETSSYGYLLKPVKGIDLHWTINTALKRHNFERSG
jgi:two-component system, response regulator PdtaR